MTTLNQRIQGKLHFTVVCRSFTGTGNLVEVGLTADFIRVTTQGILEAHTANETATSFNSSYWLYVYRHPTPVDPSVETYQEGFE